MNRDTERQKIFTRRAVLLAGGKLALFAAMAGRLYYLQVVESEKYKTLADENRINLRLLPPPRGRILDRNGLPLAVNQQNYQLVLIPEQTDDMEATLDALAKIVPVGVNDRRRILREAKRKRRFVPITVRENLEWTEVAQIEVNAPDLPGVMIDVGRSRSYPAGTVAAHVLGYVGAVTEREMTTEPLLQVPGFRVGRAGMERVHDAVLRGEGGSSQVEVNAFGRVIRELSRDEGDPGSDVRLTIDLNLQRYATERLGEESASAVVLNIHNGEILASVSNPSFDPNAFNRGLTSAEWRTLATAQRAPLINKVFAGRYAPGSTYKMIVALAALERGIITPDTRVFCPGHLTFGDAKFHCWQKRGHGSLDVLEAITRSCDVFFYEVARRTGIDAIGAMARRFGLGSPVGLDLPGEEAGLVPSPEWKRAVLGDVWHRGETLISGIGQGYLLTTPLQLAVMTAQLANGGRAIRPRLTRSIGPNEPANDDRPADGPSLGLSPGSLALMKRAMEQVVNVPHGTAFRARIKSAGFEMAGKTGTVQVRRISRAEREAGIRKTEDIPWAERDHALFVGYAPMHAPRLAVAVVVEHGGGGSAVAAPIAADILLEAQKALAPRDPASQVSDASPRLPLGGT
jgi:penicillin-binding protein 2